MGAMPNQQYAYNAEQQYQQPSQTGFFQGQEPASQSLQAQEQARLYQQMQYQRQVYQNMPPQQQ